MSYVLLQKVVYPGFTELTIFSEDVYEKLSIAETTAQSAWKRGDEVSIFELKAPIPWDKPLCDERTFQGTHLEPPEYCENETAQGSEYCSAHGKD